MDKELEAKTEAWFERRRLTLDLVGLTDDQLHKGSIFLGGAAKEIVKPDENFSYQDVSLVVFNWGDDRVENVFFNLLEHDDAPSPIFIPFAVSTVIGNYVWILTPQDKDFDPEKHCQPGRFEVMKFEESDPESFMQDYLNRPPPMPQLLSKIGTRWLLFGLGGRIND